MVGQRTVTPWPRQVGSIPTSSTPAPKPTKGSTLRRLLLIGVILGITALPALGATQDIADATGPATVELNQPATFTAAPCTTACRLTWVWFNGPRLGTKMGEGLSLTYSFNRTGIQTVRLDLSQPCVGSGGRLICHSYDYVFITVV